MGERRSTDDGGSRPQPAPSTDPGDETAGDRTAASPVSRILRARKRLRRLAAEDGEFAVACKRTGASPGPVTHLAFDSYEAAERGATAATRYREAMRELDPDLREYDLGVCRVPECSVEFSTVRETTGDRRANGLPKARQTVTLAGDRSDEWIEIENGAVIHLAGPDSLLDDEVVARQLDSKLR